MRGRGPALAAVVIAAAFTSTSGYLGGGSLKICAGSWRIQAFAPPPLMNPSIRPRPRGGLSACTCAKPRVGSGTMGGAVKDADLVDTYVIEECEPNEATSKLALRNRDNLVSFLERRPVAPHNLEAFRLAKEAYDDHCKRIGGRAKVVLDSCCGTGRSSLLLAEARPDRFVVGIDKSVARLSRNRGWREGAGSHTIPPNVVLVRGDCTDIWRIVWEEGWEVDEHFMLYPNPYPKKSDLSKRWHGGPAFPLFLGLGGAIEVRATWRTYLAEMAIAADAVSGTGTPPIELVPGGGVGMSNFEIKYGKAGLPCYRMVLPRLDRLVL